MYPNIVVRTDLVTVGNEHSFVIFTFGGLAFVVIGLTLTYCADKGILFAFDWVWNVLISFKVVMIAVS